MKQYIEFQKFIKKIAIASIITSILGALFILPCFYILPYQTGDIGRAGGIPFGAYDTIFKAPDFLYTENIDNFDSLQNAEILTIGDSFSQMDNLGYQNFLGHNLNKKINNFRIKSISSTNTAATLIKKQMIPNCKILIIESVERNLINNLNESITIIDSISKYTIISTKPNKHIYNINTDQNLKLNIKGLTSFYKSKLSIYTFYKHFNLSVPLFTANNYSNKLYIWTHPWDSDLSFSKITEQQIQTSKERLYEIKELGKKHQIQIIYMVAADKYDMYYDFIKDNPYPINPTLSYFSNFDTTFFVDTKRILLPHIKNGEKDIYRVNDTHWSVIASEIIGNYLSNIINESKN